MKPRVPAFPTSLRAKLKRRHAALTLTAAALLTGAAVNGWSWLPTGRVVVERVERAAQELPVATIPPGRLLVVSPHPDDETLAAAGIIQARHARGGEVYVVFLTSGDGFPWEVMTSRPRSLARAEDYLRLGRVRMAEARRATAILGVPRDHVFFLGFPDRGLTKIDTENYLAPYRSPYTRVDRVPYDGVVEKDAPYTGRTLARLLGRIMTDVSPDVVLAPSVRDGHPDHRAASFLATRLASERGARLYYYVVHGGLEWPLPKGLHRDMPLTPPNAHQGGQRWHRFDLTESQEDVKAEAVRAYPSQLRLLSRFMWA
ncbi:PIG-L deacetylase family protein, partial [Deinococcus pimensis]|uniref:PIG-L deacetylase family protein n=1 Tax=Deinococcus pimensis TaxID=309888 RepID=UPI001B7F89FE